MVDPITTFFPRLNGSSYRITSPRTRDYNCIAWAAEDPTRWWWPDPNPDNDVPYWPATVPREETLEAFLTAFALLGYVPCDSEELEPGFRKIALFADTTGRPTHAARQLPDGQWTSKLGTWEDITHALHDLSGPIYGTVVRIVHRSVAG